MSLCLSTGVRIDAESETLLPINGGVFDVAHALRGEGFDASEDGTGRGTTLVPVVAGTLKACKDSGGWSNSADHAAAGYMLPVAIQEAATRENAASGPDGVGVRQDGSAYTLEARQVPQAVAFDMRGREGGAQLEGPHDTANIRAASGGSSRSYVAAAWQVRRLTPVECERLQAFPDDFTRIPYRNKPADICPDGPRYKALGNSWAVNCAEWIGERMAIVDLWEAAA